MATDDQNSPATVFIVDDDNDARKGLQRFLKSHGYQIESFSSAMEFLGRLPIDEISCLVLDLQMPEMTGLDLQEELAKANVSIPIVFLTGQGDIPATVKAIKRGAEDFLPKLATEEELVDAIERALQRSKDNVDNRAKNQQVEQCAGSLTRREREVCELVIAGLLNKQIAVKLGISERTVKAHRAKVMQKFGVQSIAELVRLTAKAGILPQATE